MEMKYTTSDLIFKFCMKKLLILKPTKYKGLVCYYFVSFFSFFFSANTGECHWTLAVIVSLSSVRRLRMFDASRCLSPMPACHR